MSKEMVPVYISQKLYEQLKKKIQESRNEFKTVEEFIEYVLTELLNEEEETSYRPEEEEVIKKRLKALGYL